MWDFGNTANPRHRRHTYLEVHLVPCTEIIEVVTGRLCQIFQILLLFYFTSFPRFSSLSVYRSETSCKVLGWWDTHRNGEKLVFRSLKATADRLGASLATALTWFCLWWHVVGVELIYLWKLGNPVDDHIISSGHMFFLQVIWPWHIIKVAMLVRIFHWWKKHPWWRILCISISCIYDAFKYVEGGPDREAQEVVWNSSLYI